MALRLEQKKVVVSEVSAMAGSALSMLIAEYRGLKVSELTELRAKARQNDVAIRVVPNTLARRALAETSFACMDEALKGPVLLAFANEDPGAAARIARDFAKENKHLKVTALSLGDTLMGASELDVVANLPTRDQALSMLLSVMQAPITKLVRTLAEPQAKLVRVLAAIRDKKQAAE